MSKHQALRKLQDEARLLTSFLEEDVPGQESVEPLIDRYLDFKTMSAQALRDITDEQLERDEWALDGVLERLESELRSRLAGILPLEVVVVKRYGKTHRKLYEYLWEHRGTPVSAARLRVLTGDQVHTERRIREIRDAGLRISAKKASGQNIYELASDEFDVEIALRRFVPEFVKAIEDWSPAQRRAVLERFDLA
jgi:hypothetical protein